MSAQWISGREPLPGLSVEEQAQIRQSLDRTGPQGRTLRAFFIEPGAESLSFVNPELKSRLHHMSRPGSEANCYFTSLFALGRVGLPERFMDLPEYDATVRGAGFREVSEEGVWLPGDVLRLKRTRGNMDLHSVVYVGRLQGSSSYALVLSKNGPSDGPYLIMSLDELMTKVYPSSYVAGVYRPL